MNLKLIVLFGFFLSSAGFCKTEIYSKQIGTWVSLEEPVGRKGLYTSSPYQNPNLCYLGSSSGVIPLLQAINDRPELMVYKIKNPKEISQKYVLFQWFDRRQKQLYYSQNAVKPCGK